MLSDTLLTKYFGEVQALLSVSKHETVMFTVWKSDGVFKIYHVIVGFVTLQ